MSWTILQGAHPTSGLSSFEYGGRSYSGFEAIDIGNAAGSPVVAPEPGRIVKLSGHPTEYGAPEGVHGPFGESIYLLGQSGVLYFITHLGDDVRVKAGQVVRQGDPLGSVGDYAAIGGANHVHVGIAGVGGQPSLAGLIRNAGAFFSNAHPQASAPSYSDLAAQASGGSLPAAGAPAGCGTVLVTLGALWGGLGALTGVLLAHFA